MVDHPGEKAKLAAYGAKLLWQPKVPEDRGPAGQGHVPRRRARLGRAALHRPASSCSRSYGLVLVPRHFAALAVALLGYQTVMAMLFMGQTRYRVPWDFLIMILAAAAAVQLAGRLPFRNSR